MRTDRHRSDVLPATLEAELVELVGHDVLPATPEADLVELVRHLEGLGEELGMARVVVRARRVRRLLEVLRNSEREDGVDRPSRGVGRRAAR